MTAFYINVSIDRNVLYVTEIVDGQRVRKKIKNGGYEPYLFLSDPTAKDYRTVDNLPVKRIDFNSIGDAKTFIKSHKDISNSKVFGLEMFQYTYINDTYIGDIKYKPSDVFVGSLDIETDSQDGFPDMSKADKAVTAITITCKQRKKVISFGLTDFDVAAFKRKPEYNCQDFDIQYIQCTDEHQLLKLFLHRWDTDWSLDVVTGWNIQFFDIPYLVNRITNELGKEYAEKLSPWRVLRQREVVIFNRPHIIYEPMGLNILDYIDLYKKFSNTPQESYKLDWIAQQELKKKKVAYQGTLAEFYINDPQQFMEYNIIDCLLVDDLEIKLRFIELVMTIAYFAKVNYSDTLTTIRTWDVMIHNYLLSQNIVIPPIDYSNAIETQIEGAYVKDPFVGLSHWVASFDFTSLYPSLIRQYNISPETFVRKVPFSVDQVLNNDFDKLQEIIKEHDLAITGSGCLFLRKQQGFLPKLMSDLFQKRVDYRAILKKIEDKESDEAVILDKKQHAIKILLNSGYGALANKFFRWFKPDLARSITLSGQMTIRYVEQYMNAFINKFVGTENEDYVIAADTDSQYISCDAILAKLRGELLRTDEPDKIKQTVEIIDKICKEILSKQINLCIKELADSTNAREVILSMNREVIADKGVWTGKKHYILNMWDKEGQKYYPPKSKIMGIDAVKSSLPFVCRDAIKEAITLILNKDNAALIEHVANFKKKFYTLPFNEIASPRGMNGLRNYTLTRGKFTLKTPTHVRSALIYNDWVTRNKLSNKIPLIQDGEKIKYCYLIEPNPLGTYVGANLDVIQPHLEIDKYFDYPKQYETTFLNPLRSLTEAIGWNTEHVNTLF